MNTVGLIAICNMALSHVGVSRFIDDIDEGSNEANICKLFWESCRDQCLQDFPWGFAMKYAELQLLTDTIQGWAYCYGYPSDCLQARMVIPTITSTDIVNPKYYKDFLKPVPFKIVSNSDGNKLMIAVNIETPTLVYTVRITSYALWSPAFVNALAYLLATKICSPLSASPEYATLAGQEYQAALLHAGALSMNEGKEHEEPESEFITARR